jgi:Fe-S oxidoreductase
VLPARLGCCGAGGATFLQYPEQATALAVRIGDYVSTQHLSTLVSSNLGCILHLQTALADTTVKTPIHLLAKSLGFYCRKADISFESH